MRIFFHKSADYIVGPGGFLASLTLLLGLLFGETILHEQAYAELGQAVALLSVLGSAVSIGYLAFFVFRIQNGDFGLRANAPLFSSLAASEGGSTSGKDWPLLMRLLFRSIPILFAGLAGWVEARA